MIDKITFSLEQFSLFWLESSYENLEHGENHA